MIPCFQCINNVCVQQLVLQQSDTQIKPPSCMHRWLNIYRKFATCDDTLYNDINRVVELCTQLYV